MTQQTATTTLKEEAQKRKAIDVSPELWEDFRVAAIRRKYPTVSKAVEAALRHWIDNPAA